MSNLHNERVLNARHRTDRPLLRDLKSLIQGLGLGEGTMSTPGNFVIERTFVEQ